VNNDYTDPAVKLVGSAVIIVAVLALFLGAAYWFAIGQFDSQVQYCHKTKTYIAVRDCKEVR